MAFQRIPTPLHDLYPTKHHLRSIRPAIPEGPLACMYQAAAHVRPELVPDKAALSRIRQLAKVTRRRLHPEWEAFYSRVNTALSFGIDFETRAPITYEAATAKAGGEPTVPELVSAAKRARLLQGVAPSGEYDEDDPKAGWFPHETPDQRTARLLDPATMILPGAYRPGDRSDEAVRVRACLRRDKIEQVKLRKEAQANARRTLQENKAELSIAETLLSALQVGEPGWREAWNAVVAARGRMRSAGDYPARVAEDLQVLARTRPGWRVVILRPVRDLSIPPTLRTHHWSMD